LPWSFVVGWAASYGRGSVQRRAGVTSAIATFVALVALVMRIDEPAGMFDTVALAAVPGWPIGLLVGSYLRDRVLPQWLDMAWAIGIGTSPVIAGLGREAVRVPTRARAARRVRRKEAAAQRGDAADEAGCLVGAPAAETAARPAIFIESRFAADLRCSASAGTGEQE
jgi:hypothetical protein